MGFFSSFGAAVGGFVGMFGGGVGAVVGALVGGTLGALADMAVDAILQAKTEAERQKQRELITEYRDLRHSHGAAEAERIRRFYREVAEAAERRMDLTRTAIERLKQLKKQMIDDERSKDLRKTLFLDRNLLARNIYEVQGQIDHLYAFDMYLRQYLGRVRPLAQSASDTAEIPEPPCLVLPPDYPARGKLLYVSAADITSGYVDNEWCGRIQLIDSDSAEVDENGDVCCWVNGYRHPVTASARKGTLVRRKRERRWITARVTEVSPYGVKLQWEDLAELTLFLPNGEKQPLGLPVIPRTMLTVQVKHLDWDLTNARVTMRGDDANPAAHNDDAIYLVGGPDLSPEEQKQIEAVLHATPTVRIAPLAEAERAAFPTVAEAAAAAEAPLSEAATLGLKPDYLVLDFGQVSLICELLAGQFCLRVLRLGPGAPQTASAHTRRWIFAGKLPTLANEEREGFARLYYEMQDSREKVRQATAVTAEGREQAFLGIDYLQEIERLQRTENQVAVIWETATDEGRNLLLGTVTFVPRPSRPVASLAGTVLATQDGTAIGTIVRAWCDEEPDVIPIDDDADVTPESDLGEITLEVKVTGDQARLQSGAVFINPEPLSAHATRQRWAMNVLRRGDYVNPRLLGLLLAPDAAGLQCTDLPPAQADLIRAHLADEPPAVVEKVLRILAADDAALVMGPPGTGKTTLSSALIRAQLLLNPDARIAVCSQSHYAVDELFMRLSRHIPPHRLMRIGRVEKVAAAAQCFMPEHHLETYRQTVADHPPATEPIAALRDDWQARIAADPDYLQGLFIEHASVIGATTSAMGGAKTGLRHHEWDLLLVDEAARLTLTELLVPAVRAKKIVMVGDQRQLPPVIDRRLSEHPGAEGPWAALKVSHFEWLWQRYPDTHKFHNSAQFRMPPAVGDMVSALFYANVGERLTNGRGAHPADLQPAIQMWHVEGHQEPAGTSWINRAEIDAAIAALHRLKPHLEQERGGARDGKIVFLTPYAAQRTAARAAFAAEPGALAVGYELDFRSVEEYQGHEAAVVLLSLVRTGGNGAWVQNPQRLNVALSRPVHGLILLGHRRYWVRQQATDPLVARLYEYGEQIPGCVRTFEGRPQL